ncbi:MAG: pseudouridine synthase, RluA family [Phycisphaerales bacterium]|nr:pseudouridine synthase, RluA family [Phycisphaerales bacterium]
MSLLEVLERKLPGRSRSDLRKLLSDGRVRVNGKVNKIARMPIAPGDAVRIGEEKPPAALRPPFPIVHLDDDLLVIDKPAGLITSSTPKEKRPTALAIARAWAAVERPRAKVGLVHRLDADASGLLVFSLNNAAHASLKNQFFDHSAGRSYAAIVAAKINPPTGEIKSRLIEHVDGTVHLTTSNNGQPAVTHYEVKTYKKPYTLLTVTLETGRKHQIRTHLHSRGWPIIGDRLYEGAAAERLMLAAVRLQLVHPRTGETITFEAPQPPEFDQRMNVSARTK